MKCEMCRPSCSMPHVNLTTLCRVAIKLHHILVKCQRLAWVVLLLNKVVVYQIIKYLRSSFGLYRSNAATNSAPTACRRGAMLTVLMPEDRLALTVSQVKCLCPKMKTPPFRLMQIIELIALTINGATEGMKAQKKVCSCSWACCDWWLD